VELLKVRAGLDAELVVKPAPDLAVGSQGIGLSVKSVQRHHSLFVKLFLKRMLCKQAVDLRKRGSVPAQSQLRLNLEPLRDRPHLLQAGDDRRCEPEICDIREHLAAP